MGGPNHFLHLLMVEKKNGALVSCPFWRSFAKDPNILRLWLILLIFCHFVDVLKGFSNILILRIFVTLRKSCKDFQISWAGGWSTFIQVLTDTQLHPPFLVGFLGKQVQRSWSVVQTLFVLIVHPFSPPSPPCHAHCPPPSPFWSTALMVFLGGHAGHIVRARDAITPDMEWLCC